MVPDMDIVIECLMYEEQPTTVQEATRSYHDSESWKVATEREGDEFYGVK